MVQSLQSASRVLRRCGSLTLLHLLLHELAEDLARFALSGGACCEALLLLGTQGVGVEGGDAVGGALLDEGGDGRDHH